MAIKNVRALRALRIAKKSPGTFMREFFAPLWNRDQLLALLVALVGTYLIFQTANHAVMVAEFNDWGLQVEAFGWALVIWAAIMAFRAPFVAVSDERRRGAWHNRHFVYHEPMLAKTFLVKPTGKEEKFKFEIPDVEPGAYVEMEIEIEGPAHLAKATIGGRILTSPLPYLAGRKHGFALPKGSRSAILGIELPTNAISATVRIWCKGFRLGPYEDQDGQTGNYDFPLRPPPKGDDRP